ncbi:phosphoheptose isomerase [Candidatus Pelagibacter sp.]|nr:phosphoheptose isomerase [Candidatus Pelagibacter sp.]
MTVNKKLFNKIVCFDIDGVICKNINNEYHHSQPILKTIKLINNLYNNNYYIKLFTARFMGRNNDDCVKAKKQGLNLTKKQLKAWNVKYHELIMCKPSYDLFIDDKNLGFTKDWHKYIKKKLV